MLKSLSARNFLGIDDITLDLGPVTVIWGPNEAGKSSVIDAIRHVFTGKPTRWAKLGDHVRQPATSFDIEVITDASEAGFARHRARSGNPRASASGVDVDEAAYAAEVLSHLGADAATIDAALRSGALFELEASDLQKLIAQLCRTPITPETIVSTLGPTIVEAARQHGIAIPKAIAEFPAARKAAEEVRLRAFQAKGAAKKVLDGLPMPTMEIPEGLTLAAVESALADRRQLREQLIRSQEAAVAYDAGKIEAQRAAARARVVDLEAVPAPVPEARRLPGVERELAQAQADLAQATAEVARLEKALASATKRAEGDKTLPTVPDLSAARAEAAKLEVASAEALRTCERLRPVAKPTKRTREALALAIAKAREDVADATKLLDRAETEGTRRADMVKSAKAGTECKTCGHGITGEDLARLKALVAQARDQWTTVKKALDESAAELATAEGELAGLDFATAEATHVAADARLVELRASIADADRLAVERTAAQSRIDAQAEATRLGVDLTAARARTSPGAVQALEAEVARLRPLAEAARLHAQAQLDLVVARRTVTDLDAKQAPEAPTGDLGDLEARIAKGEQLRAAIVAANARTAQSRIVDRETETHAAIDAVTKALGPDGAHGKLVAMGCGPFLDACNAAFAQLAPDYRLGMDTDGFLVARGEALVRPGALSDGARVRLLYAMQVAVARLAQVPLVALDRTELLDAAGKAGLQRLIATCREEDIQVVMLTCAPAPAAAPEGITAYAMAAGKATRIAPAQRAAA